MRATALTLLVLFAAGCPALAAPQNGFGLAGGLVAGSVITGYRGEPQRYTSAGLSALGDAQFTVNKRWSLVPFLYLTLERPHGDITGTVSNGAAGFQVRRWWGDWFLGGHVGYYVELQERSGYSQTRYGPGVGAVLGKERDDGLIWSVQFDVPNSLLAFNADRLALRVQAGWRWH